jgi:hypothetical protein
MKGLLDPNCFWNLVFLTGAGITVLTGLGGPINITVKGTAVSIIPKVPKSRQARFFVTGIGLMAISILMIGVTHWGGLVSDVPSDSSRHSDPKPAQSSFLAPFSITYTVLAAAQDKALLSEFKVPQDRPKIVPNQFGGRVAVYVNDVHLIGSSKIIVFATDERLDENTAISYESMRKRIPDKDVLADTKISERDGVDFNFGGKLYHLSINLKWYLFGTDYALIQLFEK